MGNAFDLVKPSNKHPKNGRKENNYAKNKLPNVIVVYQDNETDGKPFLVVSESGLVDVPEHVHGNPVGIYKLRQSGKFVISKDIASVKNHKR